MAITEPLSLFYNMVLPRFIVRPDAITVYVCTLLWELDCILRVFIL